MVVPAKLYQYKCPGHPHLEKILKFNTLHFTHPIEFNDPFDCHILLTADATDEEIMNKMEEMVKNSRIPAEAEKMITSAKKMSSEERRRAAENSIVGLHEDFVREWSVACFTEVRDDLVMWAHYAKSHEGLCLGFESAKSPLFSTIRKVKYSEDYPHQSYFKGNSEIFSQLLLTKSKHWEYEQEWRTFIGPEHSQDQLFDPIALTEVIFGARSSEEFQSKVRRLVSEGQSRPKFFKVETAQRKFSLEIKDLDS